MNDSDLLVSENGGQPPQLDTGEGPTRRAGETVGDFRLERHLGSGGAGEVWLARNVYTGHEVALKLCIEAEAKAILTNEAKNLGALMTAARRADFPRSIVPLLETHLSQEPPCLVMEYVPGGDLRGLLAKEGPLPQDRALRILLQVVAALEFVHGLGMTHRDIKPENILLDAEGQARVSDFGLGRVAEQNVLSMKRSLATRQKTARDISGTLDYMAPEQMDGSAEITPATDAYAIGVLMFEMLTSERPRGFTRPTRRRPELHRGWDAVFERCFAHDPADRFASMRELREALLRAFGDRPDILTEAIRDEVEAPAAAPTASPSRRKKRGIFRRTDDTLNIEREADRLEPEEKLNRYFGYGLFGWILPALMWSYLNILAVMEESRVWTVTATSQRKLVILIGATALSCYLLYQLFARLETLRVPTRILLSVVIGLVSPFILIELVFLFSNLGIVTPLVAMGLHMAFLGDVSRKLRRRRFDKAAA